MSSKVKVVSGFGNSLKELINSSSFYPEVYVYPPPRVYSELPSTFDPLTSVEFSDEMNLYLHFPYCPQLCSYCGYVKVMAPKNDAGDFWIPDEYVSAILNEMEMYRDIVGERTIQTVHIGGGTPSLLSEEQLERVMNQLVSMNSNILSTSKEVSIEGTPNSIVGEAGISKFRNFRELGINRVSIGVQSLDPSVISSSKRENSPNISLQAIKNLQEIGIENVVCDLMIGIEGQTVQSFERSVQQVIDVKPDTVELYALGVVPGTRVEKSVDRMNNTEVYQCYEIGRERFLKNGYVQDCHNRYALPGRGSFLQEDYLFQGQSIIGFGAASRTYGLNYYYRSHFYPKNHQRTIREYLKNFKEVGKLSIGSGIFLNEEERIRQYGIYHLCLDIDKNEFSSMFGVEFSDFFSDFDFYQELVDLALIEEDENWIRLTHKGELFRDVIARKMYSANSFTHENTYREVR